MQRFNVFGADFEYAADKLAGHRCGTARFGPVIGGLLHVQHPSDVDYWHGEV